MMHQAGLLEPPLCRRPRGSLSVKPSGALCAQRMPGWWEWYSNVNPVAWSVYGLVASQLGDDYTSYVNTCGPSHQKSVIHLMRPCRQWERWFRSRTVM